MPQPVLDKVRVLELTDGIAGPFCAKMLAQYGAEVIRVETPSPPARAYDEIARVERIALDLHLNTDKKSVTLDLELERGRELLRELAGRCDVIVESMRPGTVEGLGIGYGAVSERRPDLVMTSITPFGQTGPYRYWSYTELTMFAMTGAMNREGLPSRYPLKYGGEIAQYFGGVAAASATMAAIVGSAMTGIGDWLDVSILECMAGHPHQAGRRGPFAYSGSVDTRTEPRASAAGAREPYAVGTFRCRDGYVSFLPLGPRMWPNIVDMIGRPDLMYDPRFRTAEDRTANCVEMERIFQGWLDHRTRAEVFDAAQEAGIPAGPVLQGAEIVENEHFRARGYFQEIDHPVHGPLRYTGLPFILSEIDRLPPSAAPIRGQHNDEVLAGLLGLSENEMASLTRQGIISHE